MVRTVSLCNQLLEQVPRYECARLVNKHQAERDAKGFTCWTQFSAILFCQLARVHQHLDYHTPAEVHFANQAGQVA